MTTEKKRPQIEILPDECIREYYDYEEGGNLINGAIRRCMRKVRPAVTTVYLYQPDCGEPDPESFNHDSTAFAIFCFSQAYNGTDYGLYNEVPCNGLWGVEWPNGRPHDGYPALDSDKAIKDDDGNDVAELFGNNLFILHDIFESNDPVMIFQSIMRVVAEKCVNVVKKETVFSHREKRTEKEQFVLMCMSQQAKNAGILQKELAAEQAKLADARARFINLARSVDDLERQSRAFGNSAESWGNKLEQDFEAIMAMDKVIRIKVDHAKRCLSVWTKTLYCRGADGEHEIGKFRINIELHRGSVNIEDAVHWFNLTRKVDAVEPGMQAPHIFADGVGCLGNIDVPLAEAIAKYEIGEVITIVIAFVESANPNDDGGVHLPQWPLKAKAKTRKARHG